MHDIMAPTKRTGQGPITEGDGIIEVPIDEISDYPPRPSKYTCDSILQEPGKESGSSVNGSQEDSHSSSQADSDAKRG